jgi:FKBP-type peptidyl-prolyl cis-trans isomerase
VIKCWDQGFIGMKKGSKADFVCPPDYAYGNRSRPKIPANSVLLFSVEVVDINKLLPDEDEAPKASNQAEENKDQQKKDEPAKFKVTITQKGDGPAIQAGDKI